MFTGLIEEVGKVLRVNSQELVMACTSLQKDLKVGDSIAVNGVCLTVTRFTPQWFCAEIMPITLQTTNLGKLIPGGQVNLESAMHLGDRFGGHLVAGHVDAMVPIVDIKKEGEAVLITIQLLADLEAFVIVKGSIAIDGISLTVARIEEDRCTVSLVGHTMKHTALVRKKLGDLVNIECDQIGKYIQKMTMATLNNGNSYHKAQIKSVLDMDFLNRQGYGV